MAKKSTSAHYRLSKPRSAQPEEFRFRKILIRTLVGAVFLGLLWSFFSYRLLQTPDGVTSDEVAFGYNGVLLERTLHDENGRLLPFFVLSLEGKDWRQPVTQYAAAAMFKVAGPSLYSLRQVSVFFLLISAVLFGYFCYLLGRKWLAATGVLLFLTTPILMIQSHLGLDNIAPVPFVIVWLLGLLLFEKTGKARYLLLGGVALGASIYSYKAMRLIVPIWALCSVGYITWTFKEKTKIEMGRTVGIFVSGILPFYLIMPLLQWKYPGSITGGATLGFESIYKFIYYYFSNLDPSFLFITGDTTPYHSTGKHGMLLLGSVPLFVIGMYQAIKRKGFWLFSLVSLLSAPLLFGFVGSDHRASRLLAVVPLYALICALGALSVWQLKRRSLRLSFLGICLVFITVNYFDFVHYYWYTYPKFTSQYFGGHYHTSYIALGEEAKRRGLTPYIEASIQKSDGYAGKYFALAYVNKPIQTWQEHTPLPKDGILMSVSEHLDGMRNVKVKLPAYNLLINVDN